MQDTNRSHSIYKALTELSITSKNFAILSFLISQVLDTIKFECTHAIIANSSTNGETLNLIAAKNSILDTPEREALFIETLSNTEDLILLSRIGIWLTEEKKALLISNLKSLCHLVLTNSDTNSTAEIKRKSKHTKSNTKRALALKYIQNLDDEYVLKNICVNILSPDSFSTNLYILLRQDNFYEGIPKSDFYRLTFTQFNDIVQSKYEGIYIDKDIQQACSLLFTNHRYIFCSSIISSTLFNELISNVLDIASQDHSSFSLSGQIKFALPKCKNPLESAELQIIEAYQEKLSCGLIAWFGEDFKKQHISISLINILSRSNKNITEWDHCNQHEISNSTSLSLSQTSLSSVECKESSELSVSKSKKHASKNSLSPSSSLSDYISRRRSLKSKKESKVKSADHSPEIKRSSITDISPLSHEDKRPTLKKSSSAQSLISRSSSLIDLTSYVSDISQQSTESSPIPKHRPLTPPLNLCTVASASPELDTYRPLNRIASVGITLPSIQDIASSEEEKNSTSL